MLPYAITCIVSAYYDGIWYNDNTEIYIAKV